MSHQHSTNSRRLIVVGDHETIAQIDHLTEAAAERGALIIEAHAYEPGEASATDDLTEVDAVVHALGRAITHRANVWVPFPMQDLGREQHNRRLSLALQRHGLNLMVGPALAPCPIEGGLNAVDYALRAEVRAVDGLDRAALAAGAVVTLGDEIQQELAKHAPTATTSGRQLRSARRRRKASAGAGAGNQDTDPLVWLQLEVVKRLERRFGPAPTLPSADAPWPERQPALKEYARWLVGPCGLKQSLAAGLLNALGQRTRLGREWQRANLGALVNGRYDGGVAA